ncbi:MFS transporter [Nocardia sp. NPDC057353]|uniref:MFS transporter n=1 Tax=Nocardia sp. NPDC057353 TaxID=3346104 RepID=UPI00363C4A52
MRICARSEGFSAATGPLAVAAFVVAICGSNAITPLLPEYQTRLGMSPLATAAVFAMYFVPLVVVLLLGALTSLARYARVVLVAALASGVVANLLLMQGVSQTWLLYPGRLLVGLSSALATASAAAVAVAALGARGRQFVGGASMLGAGTGLALAAVVVAWLPGTFTTVYLLNAVVAGAVLLALAADLRHGRVLLGDEPAGGGAGRFGDEPNACGAPRVSDAPAPGAGTAPGGECSTTGLRASATAAQRGHGMHRAPIAYLAGALGWAVGGLATGVLPAAVLARGLTDSLLTALTLCGSALFAAAAGSLVPALGRADRLSPVLAVLAAGVGAAGAGIVVGNAWLLLAGSVAAGFGQVAAFRAGLALVSTGLGPVAQGRVMSGYSAVAYLGAAAFVLCGGALVSALGPRAGVAAVAAVFVACCAALAFAGWLPLGVVAGEKRGNARSEAVRTAQRTGVIELLPARSHRDTAAGLAVCGSEGE